MLLASVSQLLTAAAAARGVEHSDLEHGKDRGWDSDGGGGDGQVGRGRQLDGQHERLARALEAQAQRHALGAQRYSQAQLGQRRHTPAAAQLELQPVRADLGGRAQLRARR
jgi:hypothetical protein